MTYRVLIADDEVLARDRLARLVSQLEHFEVVAQLADAVEVVPSVVALQADICLLDIHMPELSGLEVACELARLEHPPSIIFCTAHDDYALDAFEYQAVDYILKPIRPERLAQALARAARLKPAETQVPPSFVINDNSGTIPIRWDEVICLLAEDKCVTVVCVDRHYISSNSLKWFESEQPSRVLRIHRNALVTFNKIRELKREANDYWVYLEGYEAPLQVSRRHIAEVRRRLITA